MALDPERYAEQIDELLAAVDAALPGESATGRPR
jgi:hypothetical protein